MDPNKQLLTDIYNLTRDTNQMLHAQRRSAFIWGIVKFIVYAILFATPIWFYLMYVSGTVDRMISSINKLQGVSNQTQTQFNGFEQIVKSIQNSLPATVPPQNEASTSVSQ